MIKNTLLQNISLKNYTSFRVGGPAKQLYQPHDKADLISFLKTLPDDEPLLYLGLGSNVLISDVGFPGTVILMQGGLNKMTKINDTILRVEAGVSCGSFSRFAAKQHFSHCEFLAGIPGTMGGALKMNAGCHGDETWDHVYALETINRKGETFTRKPSEFKIAYRSTFFPQEEFFLSADFQFPKGDANLALEKIKELLAHRKNTQPIHLPNCGSIFQNPPGNYAAKLIEACGLKGYRIQEACVSEKHANFIINQGNATAKNIKDLIYFIKTTVKSKFNIDLIPEVHIF